MIKISVIVAVYQVEKYITRCLESLRNQTFKDFEVILIDDGCKDSSGLICDDFVEIDKRFHVYHKENEGVSSARQMGLEHAIGKYIIHVDPDDWIDESMLEELYEKAENEQADLVCCDFFLEYKQKTVYCKQQPTSPMEKNYFYDLITRLHGSCCNKLVRRSLFSDNNIVFSKNIIMWEDKFINLKLAEKVKKIAYLPKAFYHYSVNENGAVGSFSKRKVNSVIQVINWLEQNGDSIVNNEVRKLKKNAKTYAFKTKDFKSLEFYNLYPEVDGLFTFKVNEFCRSDDFFIWVALKISLKFSRFLYFCKINSSRIIRVLCKK